MNDGNQFQPPYTGMLTSTDQGQMYMGMPRTMFEFADWCLRKLGGDNMFGHPIGGIINIDITPQQVIDRIQEAVFKFNREHYNGYREVSLILPLKHDQTTYTLPKEIINVLYYLKLDDKTTMFSFDYQMRQSMGMNYGKLGGFDLVTVELAYEWLKLIEMKVGKKFNYTFNELTHELNLLTPIENLDGSVALICYMLEDVVDHPDVWQDIWLRKYAFALIKQQWGQNLGKFGSVNLPGGVTLRGTEIWTEATTNIEALEKELEDKYSYPPMFFYG